MNIADDEGWTALHRSAQSGNYELFGFIADKGTDIFLKTKGGQNCLHIAAAYGHLDLCNSLTQKHNFDKDMADNSGWEPLHHSAESGSYEMVRFFAGKRSDFLPKTKDGQNCLHIAAVNGHLNLCKILIAKHKYDVHMADDRGWTALHFSAQNGSYENVKFFADNKANICLKTKEGVNCLHIAATYGHLNLCKTLIEEHSFDVHICDDFGWSALHYSVKNGNYEMIEFFIDMGSDIYLKVNDGTNCLHIAAFHGHFNLSKMLLDNYNFDVHLANNDEWTALHCSAKSDNFTLFLYLLDKGSDIYRKTKGMFNVLHLCAYSGHFDICEFVLKYFTKDYKDHNSRNQHALRSSFCASEVFYKYSAIFLHAMDVDGNTYLHLAADGNQSNVCELLLKYDTDFINLCNKKDETARDIAKKKNYKDVLRSLKTHYDRTGMFFCVTYKNV